VSPAGRKEEEEEEEVPKLWSVPAATSGRRGGLCERRRGGRRKGRRKSTCLRRLLPPAAACRAAACTCNIVLVCQCLPATPAIYAMMVSMPIYADAMPLSLPPACILTIYVLSACLSASCLPSCRLPTHHGKEEVPASIYLL